MIKLPNGASLRPMLFNSEMAWKNVAGAKAETRRIVKFESSCYDALPKGQKCPYGKAGDWIWQRESFAKDYFKYGIHGYKSDWTITAAEYCDEPKWKPSIHMPFEACRHFLQIESITIERLHDISEQEAINEGVEKNHGGYNLYGAKTDDFVRLGRNYALTAKESFESLWESINGKGSWDTNPFVWVIKYKNHTLAEFKKETDI